MSEKPKSSQLVSSLMDRFKKATGKPTVEGLKPKVLVGLMISLYKENNSKDLEQLFHSYLDWELSGGEIWKETPAVAEARAFENFDLIGQLADNLANKNKITTVDRVQAEAEAVYGDQSVGEIRQFYRKTVGYEPLPPKSQAFIN